MPPTNPTASTIIWDPLVRFGHWALVAAFAIAWLSGDDDSGLLHVWAGYAVGAIVLLRVVWGFAGSRHARFSDFVCGPGPVFQYLNDLIRGNARRYLGHTPAGGAMIIVLLICLIGTVGTGLIEYGNRGKGPLASSGSALVSQARAEKLENHRRTGSDRRGERENESLAGELHGALANITLALVVVHVLGVLLTSVIHRENLVAAMFTGRKRSE